ncbi:hypothetical protein CU013_2177 [Enterococcus faecium]|nr:hypothetical protein [Enterococcus faecium]MBL4993711.1 hypothetical protein [Enterococcus lactis]MBK4801136.1 hypothetical protein [Enterococcus faecium]MBK4835837.1 hypothetical protein [Enterococcus faecium]MBK4859390.1 hypothetical protein [Enterococcus faecium]
MKKGVWGAFLSNSNRLNKKRADDRVNPRIVPLFVYFHYSTSDLNSP